MIGLFIHPLVLCAILYVVSRGNAAADFPRVFFVALGIGIASAFVRATLGETLGVLTVIPVLAIALFLLIKFCYVSLTQGLIAVAVFFGYLIGFGLLMDHLLSTQAISNQPLQLTCTRASIV